MGLQYNYSEITFTLPWSSVRGMFLSNRKLSHINCNEVMKIFMQIVRFIIFKVINVYKVRMKLHPYQKPTKSQHTSGFGMKSVWVMLEKSFIRKSLGQDYLGSIKVLGRVTQDEPKPRRPKSGKPMPRNLKPRKQEPVFPEHRSQGPRPRMLKPGIDLLAMA